MATLTVQEERTVSNVRGVQTFTMNVYCTSGGDLPDTGIFVFKVYNDRNPLADVFQRVATVADVEEFKSDRTEALTNRDDTWRASQVTLTYDDIEVANQAVTVIKDRINALVEDWGVYNDSFKTEEGVPDVIDFPVTDPAYVDSLKTTYSNSVTAFEAAQTAESAAEEEYNTASADLTASQDTLKEWQTEYNRLAGFYEGTTLVFTGLAPEMTTAYNFYHDLLNTTTFTASNVATIMTQLDAFFVDPDHQTDFPTFYTAYLAFQATYQYHLAHGDAVDDGNDDHQEKMGDVGGIVTTKQGLVTTAENNLNTKKASYIEAQAATQEAYDLVISSYEAVKAVCPSWSPSPPVPAQP